MTRLLAIPMLLAISAPAQAQEGAALPASEPAAPPAAAAPIQAKTAEPAMLPAPTGAGSAEIVTDQPGAEVLVDGARVGVSPVRVDGLAAGVHRVQATREGGAPVVRDITVLDGQVSRVELVVAGNPAVAGGATLGDATPAANPQAAPQSSGGFKMGLPGREFFSTFLEQPWAWAAAAICGVALLGAAVVWNFSSLQGIPVVGPIIPASVSVPANAWWAVRISVLAVAILAGGVAVLLFVWPSLPFAKWVQLPSLTKMLGMNKGDKPAAAQPPAPAAK